MSEPKTAAVERPSGASAPVAGRSARGCECGRAQCAEPIPMTVAEYEAVRAEPTHFAVVPGHEQPEIESIVELHPTYLVVEKRDEEAQEVARETDPRA